MSDKVKVVLVNEATKEMVILPRNPAGFSDDQAPNYDAEYTPAGARYQAATFENGGARDFAMRVVLLPETDGTDHVTRIMRFLFSLVEPTSYTDPLDGVTRWEPPDVSFVYGAMVRRGKLIKRPVQYGMLNGGGVAREIVIDLSIRSYVRALPPPATAGAGAAADKPDYDQFQQQNVSDFLASQGSIPLRRVSGSGGEQTPL